MIKFVFSTLFLQLLLSTAFAQEKIKAPKLYAFEIGARQLAQTTFDIKTQGTTFLFDYAWQLSGYDGRPAGYISVPMGYTFLSAGKGLNRGRILSYGWTVRHDLKSKQKNIPFFGYGLLLNQLKIDGTEGSVFGHQTRFDFGYQFLADRRFSPYLKVEYSYTRYPRFGDPKSDKIHAFELKGGLRFSRH
jgi:hypothetical protein